MFTAILISLCIATVASTTSRPGIELQLSENGFNYFASVAAPLIEAKIKTITIPNFSGNHDSFDYSVSNIKVKSLTLDNVKIASVVEKGLSLSIDPIGIALSADWSYRETVWPHVPNGGGSLDATVGGATTVSTSVALTAGSDGKPHAKHIGSTLMIDSLDIQVHGSIFSWLYDLIVSAFKDTLKKSLESAAADAVNEFWDTTADELLGKYKTLIPLTIKAPYDISQVDDSIVEVTSLSDRLILGVKGEVEALASAPRKIQPYPGVAPSFAANPTGDAMIRIKLSPFALNSGAWTFFQYGLIKFEILPEMVPTSSPVKLNTSDTILAGVAPGLARNCPDEGIRLTLNGTSPPVESETSSGIGVTVPVDFIFTASNCTSANRSFALRCASPGGVVEVHVRVAGVSNETLLANVTYLSCQIESAGSDVGPIQSQSLQQLIDLLIPTVVVPFVNAAIANGFPIPTFDGLTLYETEVVTNNNTLYISSDVKYVPPPSVVAY